MAELIGEFANRVSSILSAAVAARRRAYSRDGETCRGRERRGEFAEIEPRLRLAGLEPFTLTPDIRSSMSASAPMSPAPRAFAN